MYATAPAARPFAVAVSTLAALCRVPLLADPLSQVRSGFDADGVVSAYDNFLRIGDLAASLEPDFVLRFGAQPTSKPLQSYLQRHAGARQVLVSPDGTWRDPDLTASAIVQAEPASFCEALLQTLDPASRQTWATETWYCAWRDLDGTTRTAIETVLDSEACTTEPSVFADLANVLPAESILFAGNSMPVRDLDSFFPASDRRVRILGNRGTSGIDGVVSTALGVAAEAADSPPPGRGEGVATVLVIGDLSFYHDMNGLLAARRFGLKATIVLVNNDGGGIFSFLPQNDDPEHFEALFGTPHGLDFAPVAELYGLGWTRVTTREEYHRALEASFQAPGVQVIEVKTDRAENLKLHQRIWREVAEALTPPARP
jgi:2-succinyl-5-enolpyruvyl-6-hydroxy-3-cyclohexene-1-carboxylate synthase